MRKIIFPQPVDSSFRLTGTAMEDPAYHRIGCTLNRGMADLNHQVDQILSAREQRAHGALVRFALSNLGASEWYTSSGFQTAEADTSAYGTDRLTLFLQRYNRRHEDALIVAANGIGRIHSLISESYVEHFIPKTSTAHKTLTAHVMDMTLESAVTAIFSQETA